MRRATPVVLTGLALGLAFVSGCGEDDGPGAAAAPATTATTPTGPGAGRPGAFQVPSGVPGRSDGTAADPVSRRVIRKWLGALRAGNIGRAARFFSLPSKVQNGTRVLTLTSPEARLVFNETFPCGARATRLERAAGGFTIVDFVLTERPGGNCAGGVGGRARSAIRVRDGHIAEWYRLDELPRPGGTPGSPPSAPVLPGTQIA